MNRALTFNDVLIKPKFSLIKSRKDVLTDQVVCGENLRLPLVTSNMDTVTGPIMAKTMLSLGSQACLHRFCTVDRNVEMFIESQVTGLKPWVSIGLGEAELERGDALVQSGAEVLTIDVAHGASIEVVKQAKAIKHLHPSIKLIVGNFATGSTIQDFVYHVGSVDVVDTYKVNIGSGAACTTRLVTGVGLPAFETILDCSSTGFQIIADGGITNSGDFCKALGAGATAVMCGKLFAGCEESPSLLLEEDGKFYKKYRGSASLESYKVQGKESEWRTPEGDSYLIPYTGPVKDVLRNMEAGLRSAMSYVGASNLEEFRQNVEFVEITPAGTHENGAHGQ